MPRTCRSGKLVRTLGKQVAAEGDRVRLWREFGTISDKYRSKVRLHCYGTGGFFYILITQSAEFDFY